MVRKITIFVVMILLAISGGLLMLRRQPQMDSHSRSTRDMRVHYSCPDLEGGRRLMTCPLGRVSSVTPAQSNEIAVAFCRMAEVYERGERVQMLAIMESVPDVVTNMPDRAFALAVEPIRSVLDRGFVHAEGLSDFDLSLDFERFGRINLDAVLFLGNLYLKRGGDCGLQLVYDSQTLKQLMRYRDMFHEKKQLDCEEAAVKLISEWLDQIESADGFTRRYMWFQVALQWPRYREGKMTIDELSCLVKSYAQGLIRLGYTPKWLSEFDDLSEAVK